MKNYYTYIIVLMALLLPRIMSGQEPMAVSGYSVEESTTYKAVDTSGITAEDTLEAVVLTYPQILLDMPNVHVEQDSLITQLMEEKIAGVERGEQERAGFRVQIYSSNNPQRGKSEALLLEQRVKQVLNVPVYVIYASPSWKVRLGDFLSEQDAITFRDAFREQFPELADYTYIVRDQVKAR